MPRLRGLDHHLPAVRTAAGAAGDLHHQLERPLRGPEIGVVQQIVGIEDTHERHAAEIEPLGNHLRSDQDVGLASLEVGDDSVERPLRSHAVAVEPRHARRGEQPCDLLLDLFGAEAARNHVRHLARRAFHRHGGRIAAVMADESSAALVVGRASRCSADSVPSTRTPNTRRRARTRGGSGTASPARPARAPLPILSSNNLLKCACRSPRLAARIVSETNISGGRASPYRSVREASPYFPLPALTDVSSEGVALPSSVRPPHSRAITTAQSRAL